VTGTLAEVPATEERAPAARRRGATVPRWHWAVLIGLVVLAAARGLYWVGILEIWRGDEAQHYSYVQQIAEGEGIPVIGVDHISDDAALLYRLSTTNGYHAGDFPADGDDPRWGAPASQYQGTQGPSYYALLALPYRLADGASLPARLLVVRIASMLLLVTAVPLTWLLARAIVPSQPRAWLLAPALVTAWQGINVAGSGVSNDALATPLALAALTAMAWAYRRGPTLPLAATAGLCTGLAVMTKASTLVVAPLLVLLTLGAAVRHRPRIGSALAWTAVAGVSAAIPVLPWLAWQERAYGPSSTADAFNAIIGPIVGQYPLGREALSLYLRAALQSLFNDGNWRPAWERYSLGLLAVVAVVAVAGAGVALLRRRADEAYGLAVLAVAFPLGFAVMVAIVHLVLDDHAHVAGRYFLPALPGFAVVIAGGLLLALGRRAGTVAVALVAAASLSVEIEMDHTYVQSFYLRGLPVEGSAPVLLQDQADTFAPAVTLRAEPPCPASAVVIAFRGEPPPSVALRQESVTVQVPQVGVEGLAADVRWGAYALPGIAGPFEVTTSGRDVAVSILDRAPGLSLVGAEGDPVARVHCPSVDPDGVRFAQMHNPLRPDLTYGQVLAWPRAWAVAGWLATLVALVSAVAPWLRRRFRSAASRRG